jgi:hypothetical protein
MFVRKALKNDAHEGNARLLCQTLVYTNGRLKRMQYPLEARTTDLGFKVSRNRWQMALFGSFPSRITTWRGKTGNCV